MKDERNRLTTNAGAPVADNQNAMTAGPRGPMLLQDVWFLEKLGHFDREVIPERRMHAKGSGAYGTFTVTHDITRYTKAKIFSAVGKKTELFTRFSTVAGSAERPTPSATSAASPSSSIPKRGTGIWWETTRPSSSSRSAQVPRPQPRRQARSPHQPGSAGTTGTSGLLCPRRCTRSPSS